MTDAVWDSPLASQVKFGADVLKFGKDAATSANNAIKDATGIDIADTTKKVATEAILAPVNNIKEGVSLGAKAVGAAADGIGAVTGIDTSAVSGAMKAVDGATKWGFCHLHNGVSN